MKRIKAFVSMLAAAALLVMLPQGAALKVSAAEPATYAVKYFADKNEWRFQSGSTFDESKENRELYYLLHDTLKDGDNVVVYNTETSTNLDLDLGNIKLNNLTVCGTTWAVVKTGGISECYVLAGSTCSVNGDVSYAHVYDVATVTFTGNVNELIATSDNENFNSNIGCGGQVAHFNAYSTTQPRTFYDLYDFDKNTLDVSDGSLKTASGHYKDKPSDSQAQTDTTAASETAGTESTAASVETAAANSADEYDDVPKTGAGANGVWWFLTASAVCFAGSLLLKRKAR